MSQFIGTIEIIKSNVPQAAIEMVGHLCGQRLSDTV